MKPSLATGLWLIAGMLLSPPAQTGPVTPLDPTSLVNLIEAIRDDPQTTSNDLLIRLLDWQVPTPTQAPPTSTPTPSSTPTPTVTPTQGPELPIGLFARVGERTQGTNTGDLDVDDVEIRFNSGVYSYVDNQGIILEISGNVLRGTSDQFNRLREIVLTETGNGRYEYEDTTFEIDSPATVTSRREGVLYPQSQWGPFTGFYSGTLITEATSSDRDFPCVARDRGRSINLHLLEIDGQIQMLMNSFASSIHARLDPDNPDSFASGGNDSAMWVGVLPGTNFVGCAPSGTTSVMETQSLTVQRNPDGTSITGTYTREVPFEDGTFDSVQQSLNVNRQNPF